MKFYQQIIIFTVVLGYCIQFACANNVCTRFGPDYLKDELAYDFTLVDADGKEHTLSNYRGKKIILCFFDHSPEKEGYTTAPMEQLYALQDTYEILKKYNFEVIAVTIAPLQVINELRTSHKLSFIILHDNKSIISRYGATEFCYVIPSTLVIDEQGIVVDTALGHEISRHLIIIFLYALQQSIMPIQLLQAGKIST